MNKCPSLEQYNIINKIENNNIIVNSVAGSGKTTTNLFIAKKYNNSKILLLTYNSKLKLETRERIAKNNLTNIEVHSYHSFCVKYYDRHCFDDKVLKKILKNQLKPLQQFNYDILILDESQDITSLYYKLIHKIYKECLNNNIKICLLGDVRQSIYKFNNADERYMIYADKLFNINTFKWDRLNLSHSFRITHEMAEFINNCLYNDQKFIISNKSNKIKPTYFIIDTFNTNNNIILKSIQTYLEQGYTPSDIFILSPSLKSTSSPVRLLENNIKNYLTDINVYVPISDEEKLDTEILKDKIVFSTFHQVKGLERKIVFVYNFDNSYFKYYNKNADINSCPNELYVACSRASEELILIHHNQHDYLPFINKTSLNTYADIIYVDKLNISNKIKDNIIINVSVTNLIKHLPVDILLNASTFFEVKKIREKNELINIDSKISSDNSVEVVSEITGTAIPLYYENKTKGKIDILKFLSNNENTTAYYSNYNLPKKNLFSNIKLSNNTLDEKHKKYNINDIELNNIKADEMLYISNRWCAYKNGYIHKIDQIKEYTWLSEENLNKCINRLNSLNISKNALFEVETKAENKKECLGKNLIGFIDCIDDDRIFEFKCTKSLRDEHFIQTALYGYLYQQENKNNLIFYNNNIELTEGTTIYYNCNNESKVGIIKKLFKNGNVNINYDNKIVKINKNEIIFIKPKIENRKYLLYNILSDEMYEIIYEEEKLKQMVEYLIYNKYVNNKTITDEEFININVYKKN